MSEQSVRVTLGPRTGPGGCLGVFALAAVTLFVGLMMTILLAVAIWPGEVKLVAPLFCSDAQPDAFVVSDTYSVQPGETSTNFTLYCMGPGGDATDHGFFLPFLATMALNLVVLGAVVAILSMIGLLRRRLRSPADGGDRPPPGPIAGPPEGSTAGPFVQ